jgi:hypothetical protein
MKTIQTIMKVFRKQIPFALLVFALLLSGSIIAFAKGGNPGGEVLLLSPGSISDMTKTNGNVTSVKAAAPLDPLTIVGAVGTTISIKDGAGREYAKFNVQPQVTFIVCGSLGTHTITVFDKKGKETGQIKFNVDAKTNLSDGGKFENLFNLLYKGMCVYNPDGYDKITVDGKDYHYFVNWVLDNNETGKGMQYFQPYASDMVDLFSKYQCKDGMIWSFVEKDDGNPGYFEQRNADLHYALRTSSKSHFVRQPNENHVEYLFVDLMYTAWKANGNTEWMKSKLSTAARALDYSITDTLRWSKKYKLLKRPLTIDSWDFQVDDEYTPDYAIGKTMALVPGKTKFGVYFGDNTGYADACDQLAEMMNYVGQTVDAEKYKKRSTEIRNALNALSWNGKFFTHFIDEDASVKRDLGVDMKSQIAQGNCYSINRRLPHEQCKAIIETYLNLKKNLPMGSPGEWYAIYPPFEKGFGSHNEKWQYMNGGVASHAAGELARGAYENGYENYASDILLRLLDLGNKYGDGKRIWFAYTGSIPPAPAAPNYTLINIAKQANMDLWVRQSPKAKPWAEEREGNDLRNIPTGDQTFAGIKFNIVNPDQNEHRSVIAVSNRKGYPQQIEVPINASVPTVYLLHTIVDMGSENIAGSVTFQYFDGSTKSQYIIGGKHLSGWWYPSLSTDNSGIAWRGTNPECLNIGLSWFALANPSPEKKIEKLIFKCSADKGIYMVVGITLADKEHYVAPKPESYGGPDNWAASLAMSALIEGMAGCKNEDLMYRVVRLSPRWTSASVNNVKVISRFAASQGYIAYQYKNDVASKQLQLFTTGSGEKANMHILLPSGVSTVQSVLIDEKPVTYAISQVEQSKYVDFTLSLPSNKSIVIQY